MTCQDRVTVNVCAINWLKEKYPELCIKAGLCERIAGRLYTKTYTTPPAAQRQWVGLTLEDKEEFLALDIGGSRLDAMDWAARKLKEKNHG